MSGWALTFSNVFFPLWKGKNWNTVFYDIYHTTPTGMSVFSPLMCIFFKNVNKMKPKYKQIYIYIYFFLCAMGMGILSLLQCCQLQEYFILFGFTIKKKSENVWFGASIMVENNNSFFFQIKKTKLSNSNIKFSLSVKNHTIRFLKNVSCEFYVA